MSQNDPVIFTLNDVSQLIYFISYSTRFPRQTKNDPQLFFFKVISLKKYLCYQIPDWPFRKMFKFDCTNIFVLYTILHQMILQKYSSAEIGKKPFTQQPYGQQKKVNWILSFEYFRTVLYFVCILFMSTFTGSRSILMHSL